MFCKVCKGYLKPDIQNMHVEVMYGSKRWFKVRQGISNRYNVVVQSDTRRLSDTMWVKVVQRSFRWLKSYKVVQRGKRWFKVAQGN